MRGFVDANCKTANHPRRPVIWRQGGKADMTGAGRSRREGSAGMDARGSVLPDAGLPPRLAAGAACLLRGVGQVMLQGDPRAGALFLVAVALHAPGLALALAWGVVAATGAGLLLGAARDQLRAGLFGFNGALVGVALGLFLQPGPFLVLWIGLAAALSSVMMAALMAVMRVWALPALTAPFVLVTHAVLAAAPGLPHLVLAAPLPEAEAVAPSFMVLAGGVLPGIGQVFFQDSALTGLVLALGLLVASRRAFLAALAGAVSGPVVALALGAGGIALGSGLYGFNGVLVAIALEAALPATGRARALIGLALLATPLVTAAVTALLAPLGLPGLTLPFVLVTWAFLAAATQMPGLAVAGPGGHEGLHSRPPL